MLGFKEPGSTIWLSESQNPKRKLKYTWELYQDKHTNSLIGINTNMPNLLVEEAIKEVRIPELSGYDSYRREVRYGKQSRIDFLLEDREKVPCYLEIKNVHLSRKAGVAEFPDSVTKRGKQHLIELSDVIKTGKRALMMYVIQREDCEKLSLACDIDPEYCETFTFAKKAE